MADQPRDIIIQGFRTSGTYTKREPRGPNQEPGKVIQENAPEHWVKYCNRGMPTAVTEDRVRMMDPANIRVLPGAQLGEKGAFFEHRWMQIKPAYDAWLSGQQLPEYGIPIGAWPALNVDQVQVFQQNGIKSIEDVRDMDERIMQRIRLPNLKDLKAMAGLYLEGQSTQRAAEEQAALRAELDGVKEQLDAALALLQKQAEDQAETEGGRKPAKRVAA